ncbi:hypothetical protein AO368_0925 [Moraxella catarrhalis]|nr:hypothetical protein AO368_0925 [Moraxella catarrhalis]
MRAKQDVWTSTATVSIPAMASTSQQSWILFWCATVSVI